MKRSVTVLVNQRCRLFPFSQARLKEMLARVLTDHGCRGTLSVALVNDRAIRRVHRQFLGKDTATDVISFPLDDGLPGSDLFGELVISVETARREARARRLRPEDELLLYAIHGALHLAGYDDTTPAKRRRMRRKEAFYL
jgi:probable rRNA maturation factor